MTWNSIRLELAETRDFPRGSASRVYLLRLPLDAEGAIDAAALAGMPARATVRRFWPSQADLSGKVIPCEAGWAFAYGGGNPVVQPGRPAFRSGADVLLAEPDGTALPFRVARLERLN